MALVLTFLGRVADRWQVRVAMEDGFAPRGLTLVLMSEAGRALGPSYVVPVLAGCQLASLRGPPTLPPGTRVVATADQPDGTSELFELVVDARRGLHAFLHADGLLELESEPEGGSLSAADLRRLARWFPWMAGGCEQQAPRESDRGGEPDLVDLLRNEFGVDVDDLDEELVAGLRR